MTNTIVILAAGMSSRMKKSTDSSIGLTKADEANKKSKSLITFGNKPFIYFLLENIVDAGFQNVIMGENSYDNAVLAYDRDSLNFPKERVSSFSILMTNSEFNLVNFIEKPTQEQVEQNLDDNGKIRVSMNIFKFDGSQAFEFIKSCPVNPLRNEKELPSAIVNMISQDSLYMKGIPIAEHVPDLTSKSDIQIIQKLIESK